MSVVTMRLKSSKFTHYNMHKFLLCSVAAIDNHKIISGLRQLNNFNSSLQHLRGTRGQHNTFRTQDVVSNKFSDSLNIL